MAGHHTKDKGDLGVAKAHADLAGQVDRSRNRQQAGILDAGRYRGVPSAPAGPTGR